MSNYQYARRHSVQFTLGGVILASTAMLIVLSRPPSRDGATTVMDGIGPQYDLRGLVEGSAVIAVVQPTGDSSVHWNSDDNQPWEQVPDSGILPMIVTDQQVMVLEAYKGTSAGNHLSVRTIGGIIGSQEFVDHDSHMLTASKTYLLFLSRDDWVGNNVVDFGVLSPVGRSQGVLLGTEGAYISETGLVVSTADVRADLP